MNSAGNNISGGYAIPIGKGAGNNISEGSAIPIGKGAGNNICNINDQDCWAKPNS